MKTIFGIIRYFLWFAVFICLPSTARAALEMRNVQIADVTPSGFSTVWQTSESAAPTLRIYADSAGFDDITSQVELTPFPLIGGDSGIVIEYDRAEQRSAFRQQLQTMGSMKVQAHGLQPATTYYFQALSAGAGETVTWPATGLASVTTAAETAFVSEAAQFLVTADQAAPGWIVTAVSAGALYPISAFVGDGAGNNQAFLNLANLYTADGSNWQPAGPQDMTLTVYGPGGSAFAQTVSRAYSQEFAVASVTPVAAASACDFDADGDGICDSADLCPGADDTVDTDADGIPDGCDIEYLLSVVKAGTGSGTVTSVETPTPLLACGGTCSATYNQNTTVTLTAVPGADSLFSGWSGDCRESGSDQATLTMDGGKSCTATFDTIATVPSVAVIRGGPGTLTSRTTATFGIGGLDVVSYRYQLDGGGYSEESPIDIALGYVNLSAGSHTLSVIGKDAVGNWQSETVATTFTWVVDTTSPALALSALEDGSYTNNETMNVTGTVSDLFGVESLVIGGQMVALSTTDDVNYSFSHPLALVTGSNTIVSTAIDRVGNRTEDTRTVTLDAILPVLTITSPADNSLMNAGTVEVAGTVDEAVQSVLVTTGPETMVATMAGNSFSAYVSLAYGLNTIDVDATDLAGNTVNAKRTVTFDDQRPEIAVTDPGQDIAVSQPGFTLSGTIGDLTEVTVVVSCPTANVGPVSYPTPATWQAEVTAMAEGVNVITVTATDATGNSATVLRNVLYGSGPILVNPVQSPSNAASQAIGGTMTEGATVTVSCATATVGEVGYPTATTWQVDLSELAEGDNEVLVTATDLAGNPSSVTVHILLDRTVPTTSVSPGGGTYGSAQSVILTSSEPATIYYTTDGSVPTYPADGTTLSGQSPVTLEIAASTTLTVFSRDAAGNSEPAQTILYFIEPVSHLLSVAQTGTGSGTAISQPAGIDCGTACSASFASGTTVELSAIPETGSIFTGWSGDCGGAAANTTVLIDAAKTCTAGFAPESTLPPRISVADRSLYLGELPPGETSLTQPVTIGNAGGMPLQIGEIAIGGADAGRFSLEPGGTLPCATLAPAIDPGSSCTLLARFTPSSAGLMRARVSIHSDDPETPILPFDLAAASGVGIAFYLPFEGGALPAGWTYLKNGVAATGWPAAISAGENNGGGLGGFFLAESDAPAGCEAVTVSLESPLLDISAMTPITLGFRSDFRSSGAGAARVEVSSDGGVSWAPAWQRQNVDDRGPRHELIDLKDLAAAGESVRVRLFYDGICDGGWLVDDLTVGEFLPQLTLTPSSLDFGEVVVGTTARRTLALTNTGTLDLSLGTLNLTGPAGDPFVLGEDGCSGTVLAPATDCLVEVAMSPAAAGQQQGALGISSDAPATPVRTASLTGTGVVARPVTHTISASADAGGSISPAGVLTLGAGGSQTFTITPAFGYRIRDVRVDGVSVGAVSSYTFAGLAANHTIEATFAPPSGRVSGGEGPEVTIDDVLILMRIALGEMVPTAEHRQHGDVAPLVNGKPAPDGRLDLGDVVVLLRKMVGLVSW